MKITTLILALISFNFCFSQEVETNINNSNYKKNSSKIKLLNEKIDEINLIVKKLLSEIEV